MQFMLPNRKIPFIRHQEKVIFIIWTFPSTAEGDSLRSLDSLCDPDYEDYLYHYSSIGKRMTLIADGNLEIAVPSDRMSGVLPVTARNYFIHHFQSPLVLHPPGGHFHCQHEDDDYFQLSPTFSAFLISQLNSPLPDPPSIHEALFQLQKLNGMGTASSVPHKYSLHEWSGMDQKVATGHSLSVCPFKKCKTAGFRFWLMRVSAALKGCYCWWWMMAAVND